MEKELQKLIDIEAISEVSRHYNRYADIADGVGFASPFTEDGEFDFIGVRVFHGREAIGAVFAASKGILHRALDSQAAVEGDAARQA